MSEDYRDIDGNPTPLEKLVRSEPDWAVNRLRVMRTQVTDHRAEIDLLRAALKQAYMDAGCREDEADEMAAAVGVVSEKNSER